MSNAPDLDELTRNTIKLFHFYDNWKETNFNEDAEECFKLWMGYNDPLPEGDDGERANFHFPLSYEIVDIWVSRLVTNFFGNIRPWFQFEPMPDYNIMSVEALQERVDAGKKHAALVDSQLIKNKIKSLYSQYSKSKLVFPLAILSIGWRYEERLIKYRKLIQETIDPEGFLETKNLSQVVEEMRKVWDDNEIKHVLWPDFWPDPWGSPDLDTWRGCFHREYMTKQEILDYMKQLKLYVSKGYGKGEFAKIDWDLIGQNTINFEEYSRNQLFAAVGTEMETRDEYNEEDQDQSMGMYEVIHYWTSKEHRVMINRCQVVFAGDNPYWHGMLPFVCESFEAVPDRSVGFSAVHLVKDHNIELNTTKNQMIDAMSMVLNKMFVVVKGADVDYSQLVHRRNGIIEVTNPTDVQEFGLKDVPNSGNDNLAIVKQTAENAVAVPDIIRGESERVKTAHEASIQNTNASIRFQVKIDLYEEMGIDRMLMLMDKNNQQYFEDSRLVETIGPDNARQFIEVGFEDLYGSWHYSPASKTVDPTANKEVRREQLTNIYQLVKDNPMVKTDKLLQEIFNSLDLKDAQTFIKTMDEMQQEEVQGVMGVLQQLVQSGLVPQELYQQIVGALQGTQSQTEGQSPGGSSVQNMIGSMVKSATNPGGAAVGL